jgi:hypothetical protein
MRCAVLFNYPPDGPVCVSASVPAACAPPQPGWHCDFAPDSCLDAHTLLVGFSQPANYTCGHEHVDCGSSLCGMTDGDPFARCL